MQAWIWFVVLFLIVGIVAALGVGWFVLWKKDEPQKRTAESVRFPSSDEVVDVADGFGVVFSNKTRLPLNIKAMGGKQFDLPPLQETMVFLPDFEDVLVFFDQIPIFVVDKKLLSNGKVYLGATTTLNIIYEDMNGFLPVMDIPVLRIHNLSLFPLTFGNVQVPPNTTVSYKGTEGNGIAFGTVLQDYAGIFRSVVVQQKISDVYFGIVSNKLPALFSTQAHY
ncbi:conserved putative secreted protein [Tokyovirus A1]|uniref:conserved putative secreted protein n=1 Tax=Tokyovirus A1 TaxID=1826170 RepID=UPI0007A9899B|nr:conserved putative secreted protein [Tokyovirus A1]BAU80225.1 conserved putative secreted protein [Tokyovirus A1]